MPWTLVISNRCREVNKFDVARREMKKRRAPRDRAAPDSIREERGQQRPVGEGIP